MNVLRRFTILLYFLFIGVPVSTAPQKDLLKEFYDNLATNTGAKYCADKTKLLPTCQECIPGLKRPKGSTTDASCSEFNQVAAAIREEIGRLTKERFPIPNPSRPFGLYPYLELGEFMGRQEKFGKILSEKNAQDILDIGAYYNPINLFLDKDHCPTSVVIVEPILNPLSVIVPCASNPTKSTHIVIVPITFKYYMEIKSVLPKSTSIVCIGCDSHYGPNRKMLESAFERPYTLYMEYPWEYIHNRPFKGMLGQGAGEKMTYMFKFQPNTNETQYTKRVMKIIEYQPV